MVFGNANHPGIIPGEKGCLDCASDFRVILPLWDEKRIILFIDFYDVCRFSFGLHIYLGYFC